VEFCKWLVAVYGSNQGAHNWYEGVKGFFITLGYSVSITDEAIFYDYNDKRYITVAAATEDFTVIAESKESANLLIQRQLTECFEILDLGPINWLLSVSIMQNWTNHTILQYQKAYIEQIIKCFSLLNAHMAVTPMEPEL